MKSKEIRFITNSKDVQHCSILQTYLQQSKHLECMVAFAKMSGLKEILEDLKSALSNKLEARFVVGLDFYQTDPELLTTLLKLGKDYNLSLCISNSEYCFHPKVYAFKNKECSHVLIGSANLTAGGLCNNHALSTLIKDTSGELMKSISQQIDQLINNGEVILATKESIALYKKRHDLYRVQNSLAKRKINRVVDSTDADFETLRDILIEMKQDRSIKGFNKQKSSRLLLRNTSKNQIKKIIKQPKINKQSFIELYEPLAKCLWHSGGLERGKNIVALKPKTFQIGLKAVTDLNTPSVIVAYQTLHEHFNHIPGAGTNVITEVLHTIDNKKFAVMNQNSVFGMSLANIHNFPRIPDKKNLNAELYSEFCKKAGEICTTLGLSNFTELDALFNYAYWD